MPRKPIRAMSKSDEKDPSQGSLEIYLLGPFRVVVEGQSVPERDWSRRKPALLIKLLALQPHHQLHREQAMDLLWPESDLKSASNNLHKAIHMARHALERELKSAADSQFILTKGQQIVLRSSGELRIDLEQSFKKLEEIDQQLQVYGNNAELIRAKTRIENHQARLLKTIVQTL